MVEHETDSGHTIGKEFPEQMEVTQNMGKMIRAINSSDITPEEKKEAIASLSGITRDQMEKLTKEHHSTGPELAETIRKIISDKRAQN